MNKTFFKLVVTLVAIHGCMTGLRMAAPLLALRTNHTAAEVGMLMALFAVTSIFISLPAGRYADKYGTKRPLNLSIIFASLSATLAAFFPSYQILCFCALVNGGASSVALISLQRHAGRMSNDRNELKKIFSWMTLGPSVANVLGPLLAGFAIDLFGGEASEDLQGFKLAFVLLATTTAFSWFLIKNLPKEKIIQIPKEEGENFRAWDLLQSKKFRTLLATNWILSVCWDIHSFAVPLLGHEKNLSATNIGGILSCFAIATGVIRVFLPFISKLLVEWKVLIISMTGACLIFLVYPFTRDFIEMAICSSLLGMFLGMTQPMVMSMIHQITPENRQGEALGLRMITLNISGVCMYLIFGTVGASIGVSALFWSLGLLAGFGTRLPLRLGKRTKFLN